MPPLKAGEVLIQTELSAVSAGTELLVYRGQIPAHMALDANLESLQQQTTYPLQYGYASVGRVVQITAEVDASWLGKRVFAFQPHASHFIATPANLIPVPDDIGANAAVFLANMETAVNLVQDGKPGLGEQVVVLGQGVVGLLLASVLAQYPLAQLTVIDGIANRRQRALKLGVAQAIDPFAADAMNKVKQQLISVKTTGADLIYEVSGTPEALNLAIELSGFTSRIVIGSWYGNKSAIIALGGDAHRNQLRIITSQVSNIAPELTGRWDKARRFELTWELIRKLKPEQLISHSVAVTDAANLYRELDQNPDEILQAVFTYS
ncbi:MAG: zinc-binding alcohol dehydrogenase [Pseudomonadota bacterium]